MYWAFLARTLGLPSGCLNLFIVKRKILKINGRIKIRLNLYAHYELVEGEGAIPLMRPNKGETAVHGCHCPGDMAVHMREVLARRWVGVCVPLA